MAKKLLIMRKAVIDLGTNTFNLLIADGVNGSFTKILSTKIAVSLGMGGLLENRISPDAYTRGIQALKEFRNLCDDYDVIQITAIGTSALRDASNSAEFRKDAHEQFGINIRIVDGQTEAQLIYSGVRLTYNFNNPGMIMDIGGGSTEFIFADKDGIQHLRSFNIGVSRMYQEIKTSDPLTQADISTIENWLNERCEDFFHGRYAYTLIGASGTFETFYELIYDYEFGAGFDTIKLERNELEACLSKIIQSTQEERDLNHRIIPIRKKMAPVAAVKTQWVLNQLRVSEIIISPFSLKEGALLYY
jgi:exopolyphosphatase/guanosine-5'-triphosphate,3'-diphosphate pyrophosphatase